jgi:acetylornithine/N-succinyldiaminopimelate aminotransferase
MAHVALAVCRVIAERDFLHQVAARGDALAQALEQLAASWGRARHRGCGLLAALVLEDAIAEPLVERARAEGLLINAARPNIVRLMPQLRLSEAEIRDMAARLARARAHL